ncbi:hypothetical protein l13_19850 [Neisseria weaveri ATCC 51223]|nr:hypothetical protein l13_19850 [Neisseria weaveri ATCC 51223]
MSTAAFWLKVLIDCCKCYIGGRLKFSDGLLAFITKSSLIKTNGSFYFQTACITLFP